MTRLLIITTGEYDMYGLQTIMEIPEGRDHKTDHRAFMDEAKRLTTWDEKPLPEYEIPPGQRRLPRKQRIERRRIQHENDEARRVAAIQALLQMASEHGVDVPEDVDRELMCGGDDLIASIFAAWLEKRGYRRRVFDEVCVSSYGRLESVEER